MANSENLIKTEFHTYYVLDYNIGLTTTKTIYGNQCIADLAGTYWILGNKYNDLNTAVEFYEYLNNRLLTHQEMDIVEEDNKE